MRLRRPPPLPLQPPSHFDRRPSRSRRSRRRRSLLNRLNDRPRALSYQSCLRFALPEIVECDFSIASFVNSKIFSSIRLDNCDCGLYSNFYHDRFIRCYLASRTWLDMSEIF